MCVKNIDKQLTVFSMECFSFECYQVQLNDEQNKDFTSSVSSNHKILSHLELNLNHRLTIVDIRFEYWRTSLG